MKRIYFIRGGLLGFDGYLTDMGSARLIEAMQGRYDFAHLYMQDQIQRCMDDIYHETRREDVTILGGFSGGSVQATRAAAYLAKKKQRIDLLINLDGSPARNMMAQQDNVKCILNIYNPQAFLLGGGIATGPGIPRQDNPIRLGHLAMSSNPAVWNMIFSKIDSLPETV